MMEQKKSNPDRELLGMESEYQEPWGELAWLLKTREDLCFFVGMGEISALRRTSGDGLAEARAALLRALLGEGKDDHPREEVVSSWRL